MLSLKTAMTICVNKEYSLEIHRIVDNYVKTVGAHHVYLDNDKVFIGIETYLSISDVEKILNEKVRVKTTIVGGCIFLLMR